SDEFKNKYKEKELKFDFFREKFLGLNSNLDYEGEYNNYIAGSDIIWGKEFSNMDRVYFLDNVPSNSKKIVYAASMTYEDRNEYTQLYKKYIPDIDYISVRETDSVEFISRFTDKKVYRVLDPTLLLDDTDYNKLIVESDNIPNEPYILSYCLSHNSSVVDYTNILAKKMGLKILHFFADYPNKVFDKDSKEFSFACPREFLGYVKNSNFIFTNSFHGTCFSILFKKSFYTYTSKKNNISRIISLLNLLGLNSRGLSNFSDLKKFDTEIDYDKVYKILDYERKNSIEFLEKALER
ncbi:MAG: polysaccharide pyruvyl transferase family protein, partial [Peptoanaerobacter stomatis]